MKKNLICLGIESTAHTFGAGIVTNKGKILSNVKDSYVTEKGGIHPNEAKEHHLKVSDEVILKALADAKTNVKDIDLISFSQGPGLAPCLIVGLNKAKELSKKLKKPLVGVNHCIAHLSIGEILTKCKDPILLYVSGANTQVIAYEAGKYRIFGETLDNGCGNFLDAFARYLGLGFPGGPKIYKLALKCRKSADRFPSMLKNTSRASAHGRFLTGKNFIELPYVVKGMDVSFGGILTNLKQKIDSKKYKKEDLAFSCQETVFSMLIEVAERAMAHCNKKGLLLGGGVCCNKRLQEMARIMCEERNAKCFIPENNFLVDNGLMIAWQGILEKNKATKKIKNIDIKPYERTDDVKVDWQ